MHSLWIDAKSSPAADTLHVFLVEDLEGETTIRDASRKRLLRLVADTSGSHNTATTIVISPRTVLIAPEGLDAALRPVFFA